jgi:hypothetical protein
MGCNVEIVPDDCRVIEAYFGGRDAYCPLRRLLPACLYRFKHFRHRLIFFFEEFFALWYIILTLTYVPTLLWHLNT